MGYRTVVVGAYEGVLIGVYNLTGELDKALVKEAPGCTILNLTYPPSKGGEYGKVTFQGLLDAARPLMGTPARVILVGFSAGGQALRALLTGGGEGADMLAIDGVHTSKPPHEWSTAPWVARGNAARQGGAPLVLTHTHIQPPSYLGTAETASIVVPVAGLQGESLPGGGTRYRDGALVVEDWPSGPNDSKAHIYQATKVLPRALGELVSGQWGTGTPVESPPTADTPTFTPDELPTVPDRPPPSPGEAPSTAPTLLGVTGPAPGPSSGSGGLLGGLALALLIAVLLASRD